MERQTSLAEELFSEGEFVQVFPGIYRLCLGTPEEKRPSQLLKAGQRPELLEGISYSNPFASGEPGRRIRGCQRQNGYLAEIPFEEGENLYGLGLQFESFRQNGKRKTLRTNADAPKDNGDSHAPVPFYVSTAGYGVLADTARCVTFDCGAARRLSVPSGGQAGGIATDTQTLYAEQARSRSVTIFVPGAQGVVLYLFASGSIRGAVESYNLFSGGGALPPIWGLGALYRCYTGAVQQDAEAIVDQFLQDRMPVTMLGLEPGWHSHSYSCSFSFDAGRFPQPDRLIEKAQKAGMKLNLWEQAYVHPTAEIYEKMRPFAGDYEVWGGLVPDFALPEAGEIYGRMQGGLIDRGISAFKLDECDGSDYTGGWYFPEFSAFPSGLTGQEEKNLYGAMIQRVIYKAFADRNLRTYSQVRAGWSQGAPMGFVLYSDLYGHEEFVRAVSNASFCGLLWSPEVRQCETAGELLRRMQSVAFSPMLVINAWMIPSPPWKQFDIEKNRAGELLEDSQLTDRCREILRLRNRFVPYLYGAFGQYYQKGTPPFRALVLDYPEEEGVLEADDCWMMGEDLLVAPILCGHEEREIYLPKGIWYDFWTGERLEGGRTILAKTQEIPLYVRSGAILPLGDGEPVQGEEEIPLTLRVYGDGARGCRLLEDDRLTLNYQKGEQTFRRITMENGQPSVPAMKGYRVDGVEFIK